MNFKYTELHLNREKAGLRGTIGIIMFKPDCPKSEITNFYLFCKKQAVRIIKRKDVIFDRNMLFSLYFRVFNLLKNDFLFGIKWKAEIIKYLEDSYTVCFLVECKGMNVVTILNKYKYFLREKYGKITNPKSLINNKDFVDKVIRNMVHTVDEKEIQNVLWLVFS